MIHLVTAVSRPDNLPKLYQSIRLALAKSVFFTRHEKVCWTTVLDNPNDVSTTIEAKLTGAPFEIRKAIHPGGRCSYGIAQKNLGMALAVRDGGWYHCIDDDNVVHPDFFVGLERAVAENPGKKAFVFGQQRWDAIGSLVAAPDRMEYGKIDNTMFLVHTSLIGERRYDLDRSGREDFYFFRRIFDLHRDQFVFVKRTLAYYNYLRHFQDLPERDEKHLEPSPVEADWSSAVSTLEASVRPVRIALYSSKRDRCGIATYTTHLEDAMASFGHDVKHWGSQVPYDDALDAIVRWKPDVFHVQHEPSIMPPENILVHRCDALREAGTKVVVTLHTESDQSIRLARRLVGPDGKFVLHRPTQAAPDAVVVPMPCTVLGILPDHYALRRKFNLPEDAFVLSTVGFMIPWKDHPKILEALLPWLRSRPEVVVQVIASEHFNQDLKGYAQTCRSHIAVLGEALGGNRIRHIDDYPSDRELVERLAASDLGYVWCPFDTGSSSAAAAQFTTARCPLVATDSSHYAYLGDGIVRGPKGDMSSFVELIADVSKNAEILSKLCWAQWEEYRTRNYLETARKHLEIYGKATL